MELGADDYVPKPFEPKELLLRIKNILSKTQRKNIIRTINFGNIKIDLTNTSYILESDEWEYQPYDDTSWYLIDTSSLYYINPTNDTIFTTQCGKHRVTVFDQTTFSFNEYIFFIPCPVTVGLGQLEKIKCYGDSSGRLERIAQTGSCLLYTS